jgi:predicted nucleotidyltransferase
MRLPLKTQQVIKKYFEVFFEGQIYLFGSRVDDSQKGGDIDLYLVINNKENIFRRKVKFLSRIKREIGDQKIDVVFNEDPCRLIEQEAIKWGILL